MRNNIILVGGGGHCKSCIDVIEAEGRFKIAGIIDTEEKQHQKVLDYEVVGNDQDLPKLVTNYEYFLITIGQIKGGKKRKEKFDYLKQLGAKFPVIISPLAYVSKYASLGEGTIVMHKAFVNINATIGKNCILNSGTTIEHDVNIGDHCNISTSSVINGECCLGEKVFVGSNSVIRNNISIAEETVIGSGSVVVKTISERAVYVGNPAQRIDRDE